MTHRIFGVMLAITVITCSAPDAAPPIRPVPKGETTAPAPALAEPAAPVVLVTVDGVRWQDVFGAIDETLVGSEARMPNLRSLVMEHGAALGAPGHDRIDASGPNFVSMPGYEEIFSAGRATCANNECPAPTEPTFLDELAARGAKVALFSSWEKIGRAATAQAPTAATFFVSSGRPEGDARDPWPGAGAYRPDDATASAALAYLTAEQPDLLVVSLGDPDEYAHRGDTRGYLGSLDRIDIFLGRLRHSLAELGPRGAETHVVITTDHGRAHDFRDHGGAYPESSRVWLVAAGPRIVPRGLIGDEGRVHHLKDVAGTILAIAERRAPHDDDALVELFNEPSRPRP